MKKLLFGRLRPLFWLVELQSPPKEGGPILTGRRDQEKSQANANNRGVLFEASKIRKEGDKNA